MIVIKDHFHDQVMLEINACSFFIKMGDILNHSLCLHTLSNIDFWFIQLS